MNRALGWMLALTVAASGWALWTSPGSIEVTPAPTPRHLPASAVYAPTVGASTADEPLAETTRGRINPFAQPAPMSDENSGSASQVQNVLSTLPAATPPIPQPPAPSAPPPPTLAGKMMSPTGEWVVYLRDGATVVAASPGLVLPSGYTVQRLGPGLAAGPVGRASPHELALQLTHPLRDEPVNLRVQEGNPP